MDTRLPSRYGGISSPTWCGWNGPRSAEARPASNPWTRSNRDWAV